MKLTKRLLGLLLALVMLLSVAGAAASAEEYAAFDDLSLIHI